MEAINLVCGARRPQLKRNPLGSDISSIPDHLVVSALLLGAVACTSDLSLAGTWRGGNPLYPEVTLALAQTGASITGPALVLLGNLPDSTIATPLIGSRQGDSVYVRGLLMAPEFPSSKFVVEFGGRVTPLGALL